MPSFIIPNSYGELREGWSDSARAAANAARKRLGGGKTANLKTKLLHKLLHKLHDAPNVDLSKLSVGGKPIFKGAFGIPRDKMPQLKGQPRAGSPASKLSKSDGQVNARKAYMKYLLRQGISINKAKMPAASLRPSQSQLSSSRVSSILRNSKKGSRIIISKDNFIIDGHHHWVAAIAKDAKDGHLGGAKIRVIRVNAPASKLLPMTQKWTKKFGILPKAA